MPIDYHVRSEPTMTMAELRKRFGSKTDSVLVETADFKIESDGDSLSGRNLLFTTKEGDDSEVITVPLTQDTLVRLGNWVGIPAPFLKKADPDVQEWLLATLLDRPSRDALVSYSEDHGIMDIRSPHVDRIDPRKVVDIAKKVLGDKALALDGFLTPKEFRLDVIQAPPAKGNAVVGGLRFGQDIQHGHSPWVEVLIYCTESTNVVEVPGVALAIDGRSIEGGPNALLEELEARANHAAEQFAHQIEAFKSLDQKPVHDASQMVMRIGREQGLPSKLLYSTAEALPALVSSTVDTNLWEVVNAIANQATHADVWYKANIRRKIERACGAVVNEHASRCPACMGMTTKPIRPEDLDIPDPD